MKIMQIIPSLSLGGAEKFVVDICNELAKDKSNEIILCVIGRINETSLLRQQISSRVRIISLAKTPGFSLSMFYKLYRLTKNINPDIVHTHLRGLPYSTLAILLLKKSFIHTFHTLPHKEANNSIKKTLYKILFNYFGVLPVSISPAVLQDTKRIFGEKYNVLINNGVKPLKKSTNFNDVKEEIEKNKQSKDTKVFLAMGRVSKVKNHLMLIQAIKELEENGEDMILLILGSLTDEKKYANLCQNAALTSENIFILGEKYNAGDYMYCADALCMTSVYEGLPLVVLEAMSIGKPVLSTPVGGIPDVITDGINGYLSEDVSVESYKAILKKFIMQPLKKQESIKNLFEVKYTMSVCTKNYYKVYKSFIK